MINHFTPSLSNFIITILKPYKKLLTIIALIALVWALSNTFTPYALKLIIDHVVSFNGNKSDLFKLILPYVLLYISFWIVLTIILRLNDWARLKLFPSVREDIMTSMFNYTNQHSHRFFQNNFAGSLVNKILDMQSGITDILSTVDELFSQILGLSVAIITLLFIHPIFSLIMMVWVAAFFIITFIFLKSIAHLSHVFAESKSSVVGRMVDSISNIVNVRLFARYPEENCYIHESIKDAVKNDRAMQRKVIQMRICWDFTIIFLLSANLLILVYMYSKGIVTVGDFAFVITLSISIIWNLWFLAGQFVSFSEHTGRCKQALSALSIPHEIIDDVNAKTLLISKGDIQFHHVAFHYNEGGKLFHNKNILIPGGQKVGLVGFSGSGKSTFVNLILRLFEVESGEITIDGQNINHVTQQSLREQIALIPQDITLFHRTLMENIQFGNPHATKEEIIAASKKAHCHEFISQLNDDYQSMVGERGIKLSGGQRQRIAIARAMLKNAPILILDEATSSLDSVTENYIQESLALLMQNKTAIVIAHRLSTLAKMDRILVFDNGQIIEDGTHEELIARNDHYAKMWKMQAGGFLPEKEV